MRRIRTFVIFGLLISVFGFSVVIQPFGLFGNASLVRNDFTTLLKVAPFVEIELGQNVLTLENINALLNEEELKLDSTTLADALSNGFSFSLPVSLGAYVHLKLGDLRLVPYTRIDGNIKMNLPKTFAELLVGDTQIDTTYESSYSGFLIANITANNGLALVLGDFYVAGNVFVPVLYSDISQTFMNVSYTSSATPAQASVNLDATVKMYSRVHFDYLSNLDIGKIINSLNEFKDLGISFEFGYGNDNFGFAVRNIVLTPAKAYYSFELITNASINYTGEGTNITLEATNSTSEPIVAMLLTPVDVAPPIQITGYWKSDGFLMWGIMGSYWFDGNWVVKGYAGINFEIARLYYMLGFNPVSYSHTIGAGVNLFILNADLKLSMTSNSLFPGENSTPGFGVALTLSGGL
ncbi:hypothetical protein NA23_09565 [Fervidobacterium islandicum]|uniref:Uncharacterized protein n=1 Tax=Fervidobacterium islandicum TaxID=2423 RepID=A0AAI8GDW7_FERIS|nr:hypothetical protein [Fervidobacterium islandicum]AMW33455.1 hypothetical protein NA23_09565 [Fervidobacterium islandicum]